jgi:16S rRNA (cytosine967-C5)-methyltransferase
VRLRLLAFRLVRRGDGLSLRAVARAAERAHLAPHRRALLRKLVGAEIRRRATLRTLASAFARGPLSSELAVFVRLGLAQLLCFDRLREEEALRRTLQAVAQELGARRARAARETLEAALRARRPGPSGDPRRDLARRPWSFVDPVFADPRLHEPLWAEQALSLPAPLFKAWAKRFGPERARALALDALEEPPLSVRAVGVEREALARELELAGVPSRPAAHPALLLVEAARAGRLLASEPFVRGRATVQGETALRAAELVRAREGELLLDVAAAPGGKSAVLLESGARVVAADASPSRLARLVAGLERLGLGARALPVATDAAAGLRPGRFDAVLVDAPCSNTGVLAQRPEARWRYGPASRASLRALQERLLASAAERVRPGGRLVWSTCSLEPEENGRRVRAFLEGRGEFALEEELEALPDAERGPVDGGYAARLVRASS